MVNITMGRRYYCDYCEKSFIDDIEARKKHIASALHQMRRNHYYLMCRDPRTLLNEEIVKQPCRRYMQTGICQFLGNCIYTHYTREELWEVKKEVDKIEEEEQKKAAKLAEIPSLEEWLAKYKAKKSVDNTEDNPTLSVWWSYPEILEGRPDLPPSLIKFKPEQFKDDKFETWG